MKSSALDLQHELAHARLRAPLGSQWQHKKGGFYKVIGHTLHSDNARALVRYARYAGPDYNAAAEQGIEFARPIEEWTSDRFMPVDDGLD